MTSIDQVIARARQPGEFSERKRFRIARKRAIGKLRRFALADPHYYILELIQSAVANNAAYIDIRVGPKDCTFAYVGGGLAHGDLGNLFDFLFASKDRTEVGHLRELALGINAALLFEPDEVIVESGDGTLGGTSRLVLHGSADAVEIGKPSRALGGTYVSLLGMKRRRLPDGFARWANADTQREVGVIEERCLAAPVPIIVNDVPLFGFSSQRVPGLFGYKDAVSFDEGDLYGTIGRSPSWGAPTVQLLTWGVAIQSKTAPRISGRNIGGVLCFDRLRKTVDHAGIVEDERLRELWVRLQPYVEQLFSGQSRKSVYSMTHLDGRPFAAAGLRAAVHGQAMVVLVPEHTPQDATARQRASAIGKHLGVPVLCGRARYAPSLRALSGGDLRIVTPDVSGDASVRFYAQPQAQPPERPWLTPPVEVPPIPTWRLAARLQGADPDAEAAPPQVPSELASALGPRGEVKARVFTPTTRAGTGDEQLLVQVRTTGRVLWEGSVASTYAGHALVVTLPDADPLRMTQPIDDQPGAPPLVVEVARAMATHSARELNLAFRRAVAGLADAAITPGSAAAALGLAAAARMVVPRLTTIRGEPAVAFSQLDAHELDLLSLPLLRRHDGDAVDLRTLAAWMSEGHGLVYATVAGTPATLDGLDRAHILSVTPAEERWLISIIGEGSYVRVDARDVLAKHQGLACRDLALGLRAYSEFPLLVEGEENPATWTAQERRSSERALVAQLVRRMTGEYPPAPSEPAARADWEECRRHALRQLQWYACRSIHATERAAAPEVYDLALFLDATGQPRSLRQAAAALQRPDGLALYYGHAYGAAELGHLTAAASEQARPDPTAALDTVVAPPFLFKLFWTLGRARPAFDLILERTAVRDPTRINPADTTVEGGPLVVSIDVEAEGAKGLVGVLRGASGVPQPEIVVLLPDRERARAFSEMALEHGCVGWVQLDASVDWTDARLEALAGHIRTACEQALHRLLGRLHKEAEVRRRAQYVALLLAYARRHLTLTATRDGPARPVVHGELVDRVLSLPVFPSRYGGPLPGWRLVRRFCALFGETPQHATARLLRELPDRLRPELSAWIEWTLCEGNVVRQRGSVATPLVAALATSGPVDPLSLEASVTHWLRKLSPQLQPSKVLLMDDLEDGALLECDAQGHLYLSTQHWLTQWTIAEAGRDSRVFGWLLLAIYAEVNAALTEVSNEHERQFQAHLAQAIADDELTLVRGSPP